MGCNPKYDAVLAKMAELHDRKSQDYASDANRYSNFEFAGQLGALFTHPVDIAFATLIGVKLARLGELKGKGKAAQNESVQDTQMDLAVYASLWASYDGGSEAAEYEGPAREGPARDEPSCGAHSGSGYICTRIAGHSGDHIAHRSDSRVCDRWPRQAPASH